MWADYVREMGLLEIIEEEYGWITFHLEEPARLVINDMYVRPADRRSGRGTQLLAQVEDFARRFECATILAKIHRESATRLGTLTAALVSGFTVRDQDAHFILVGKDLRGSK